MTRSLRELDGRLGATRGVRPRRWSASAYDGGGAIELRYVGGTGGPNATPPPPMAMPEPAPPPALRVLEPSPSIPLPVMPAPPDEVSQPAPVPWPEPDGSGAPPEVAASPAPYTNDDDDRAVAAAFAHDLRDILRSSRSDEDLGLHDDDGFIEHARTRARQSDDIDDGEDEQEAEAEALAAPAQRQTRDHTFFDELANATTFAAEPVRVDLAKAFDAFDAEQDRARVRDAAATATATATAATREHVREVEDLALVEELGGSESFSVRYEVPLVPQQSKMSRWAAGAAMIVAWRDRVSVDPAEVARASGHWAQYEPGLLPEDPTVFEVWGLAHETAPAYTVDAFRQLLETYGPLWTATLVPGAPAHVRVISGIQGDGTPAGTRLFISDPLEVGMSVWQPGNRGSTYEKTYAEHEANQTTLGASEQHVQGICVAHARDRLAADDPRRTR